MKNSKKLKYSINSSVVVIVAIIITVLLNSILVAFDDKMSLEIDLTKDEIFKLSAETKEVLKNIDDEIRIGILYDGRQVVENDESLSLMASIIAKYTEENDKITCETIDYYNDPTPLLNRYPEEAIYEISRRGVSPMYAMIIVQGDKFEVADSSAYYVEEYEEGKGEIVLKSDFENVLTNKLASLSSEKEAFKNIYFTNGHGEKINAIIGTFLNSYGYTSKAFDLTKYDIPDVKNALIVIDSPATDFAAEEIEKLDEFLNKGGNVQVYFNPLLSNNELPKLESYLAEEWGIIRGHGVIYDTDKTVGDGGDATVFGSVASGVFADHDIVRPIAASGKRIMYSSANPLEIRTDRESKIVVEEVIKTSDSAALKTVETAAEAPTSQDTYGEYNVILTSTKDEYDDVGNKTTSKILVCGSSYAMDTFTLQSDCANNEMLINSFNWMSGTEAIINIDAKDFPSGGLLIENSAKWIWFALLVVVVPVSILAVGIFVFIKRRYE